MLRSGDRVNRYVVLRELGTGGMATVYLARHVELQSLHALKLLHVTSRRFTDRLMQEGRVQASLRHPNVVLVTDVLEHQGAPVLVLEYVDGQSLDSWLEENPELDLTMALELFRGILLGVAAAHSQGVVHRDLKPANILLADTNAGLVPKVGDFGLVKVVGSEDGVTGDGLALGTPQYMAPEQVRDSATVDQRADVFALGCVLYELICGTPPFQGNYAVEVLDAVLRGTYLSPAEIVDHLPLRVDEVIQRALLPNPDERFPTAEEMHAMLYPEQADAFSREATPQPRPRRRESAPPAPMLLPESTPEPTGLSGGAALGAGIAVGGVLLLLLLISVLLVLGTGGSRPVEVAVQGVSPESPVDLRLAGQAADDLGPHIFSFDEVAPGSIRIDWAVGEGCSTETCPGDGCLEWCTWGTLEERVERGSGVLDLVVQLEETARRSVSLSSPANTEHEVRYRLGEQLVAGDPGSSVLIEAVRPGRHALAAEAGVCKLEDAGCGGSEEGCPKGCSSWEGELLVPPGEDTLRYVVELQPPEPMPAPTLVRRQRAVTRSAFAGWLASNPAWERDAAIAVGKASRGYLSGWNGATPPTSGGSVLTSVSWYAANAYCAGRGGLADLDASPETWKQEAGPLHEWRVSGGKPAWRRYDGVTNVDTANPAMANSTIGARCAR